MSNADTGEIIPAIMPSRFEDIAERMQLVPSASAVQLDSMDGAFVDALSWPFGEEGVLPTLPSADTVRFEAHLMVKEPSEIGLRLLRAGVQTIIAHVESFDDVPMFAATAEKWREAGAKEVGISLRTDTPVSALQPFLGVTNVVQFMGIDRIGFQGQSFSLETIARVQTFHEAYPNITVAVDGGVSIESIPPLFAAGARRFVVGSALFGADDPAAAFDLLTAAVHSRL